MRRAVVLMVFIAATAAAQEKEITPTIRVGGTIFTDFTYIAEPESRDADGNEINPSSFNVARAYLNLTGTIGPRIAFRITPDITRESSTSSQTFRLKYAYVQLNLNERSWLRGGMQQTPYIEFIESVYRYRFQGPIFADREGYLASSDVGLSGRYVFGKERGEVHAGFYNGEGYTRPEANDQKAFQIRGTIRPLATMRGLRLTAFYDHDAFVEDAERRRLALAATFEHPRAHAGLELLRTEDQTSVTRPVVSGSGWSAWVTPRFGRWEGLLRYDVLEPDDRVDAERRRDIVGVAYWWPVAKNVSAALLLDRDHVRHGPSRPDDTRYAVHALLSF